MARMSNLARYEMMRRARNDGGDMRGEMDYRANNRSNNGGEMNGNMRYNAENRSESGEMYGNMNYEAEQRRRYPRRKDGTFRPRSEYAEMNYDADEDEEDESRARMGGGQMRGSESKGNIIGFDTRGKGGEKLTAEKAREWVKRMRHADGGMGEHWNMEMAKKIAGQKGVELDPIEVYAIMNALYADYCTVFQRHGLTSPEFYFDMAKAWLEDSDAVKNKAMMYYDCIVKKQG